jgi:hypothetical protein
MVLKARHTKSRQMNKRNEKRKTQRNNGRKKRQRGGDPKKEEGKELNNNEMKAISELLNDADINDNILKIINNGKKEEVEIFNELKQKILGEKEPKSVEGEDLAKFIPTITLDDVNKVIHTGIMRETLAMINLKGKLNGEMRGGTTTMGNPTEPVSNSEESLLMIIIAIIVILINLSRIIGR